MRLPFHSNSMSSYRWQEGSIHPGYSGGQPAAMPQLWERGEKTAQVKLWPPGSGHVAVFLLCWRSKPHNMTKIRWSYLVTRRGKKCNMGQKHRGLPLLPISLIRVPMSSWDPRIPVWYDPQSVSSLILSCDAFSLPPFQLLKPSAQAPCKRFEPATHSFECPSFLHFLTNWFCIMKIWLIPLIRNTILSSPVLP